MKTLSKEELEKLSTKELQAHLIESVKELPDDKVKEVHEVVMAVSEMSEEEAEKFMEEKLKEME